VSFTNLLNIIVIIVVHLYVLICLYIYMYICIYVYMYICIYVYMYIYLTNITGSRKDKYIPTYNKGEIYIQEKLLLSQEYL